MTLDDDLGVSSEKGRVTVTSLWSGVFVLTPVVLGTSSPESCLCRCGRWVVGRSVGGGTGDGGGSDVCLTVLASLPTVVVPDGTHRHRTRERTSTGAVCTRP